MSIAFPFCSSGTAPARLRKAVILPSVMPRFAPGEYWADFEAGIARAEAEEEETPLERKAVSSAIDEVYTGKLTIK